MKNKKGIAIHNKPYLFGFASNCSPLSVLLIQLSIHPFMSLK